MQNRDKSELKRRIETELRWCFTFEQEQNCKGAGGRKLRQICIYCPKYQKGEKKHEKNH